MAVNLDPEKHRRAMESFLWRCAEDDPAACEMLGIPYHEPVGSRWFTVPVAKDAPWSRSASASHSPP